ncbi:PrgI family protein [Lentzea sp. E54]|uniref:PrgI family protein n=1 Tax=Lentzea xerophila TaxID=3435883 RepID=UPI003DA46D6D
MTVHIPADVDRPDRVLAGLTARQLTLLATAGALLYVSWTLTRSFLPWPVFLALAVPVGVLAVVLTFGQRDGMPLDVVLLAAIRHVLTPRHRVAAPDGVQAAPQWLLDRATDNSAERVAPLRLPTEGVDTAGVVDLGTEGLAVMASCSTINFALRTPAEQEALVAGFARYLHSLTAPVQVLVRTEHLDLSTQIAELRDRAAGLPHPALEAAALEHADYLAQLGEQTDLLRRELLLILREPLPTTPTHPSWLPSRHRPSTSAARRAAESRLVRRLHEATELLGPAGIALTPLDAARTTSVLVAACNPDTLLPPAALIASSDEVITTAQDWSDEDEE